LDGPASGHVHDLGQAITAGLQGEPRGARTFFEADTHGGGTRIRAFQGETPAGPPEVGEAAGHVNVLPAVLARRCDVRALVPFVPRLDGNDAGSPGRLEGQQAAPVPLVEAAAFPVGAGRRAAGHGRIVVARAEGRHVQDLQAERPAPRVAGIGLDRPRLLGHDEGAGAPEIPSKVLVHVRE